MNSRFSDFSVRDEIEKINSSQEVKTPVKKTVYIKRKQKTPAEKAVEPVAAELKPVPVEAANNSKLLPPTPVLNNKPEDDNSPLLNFPLPPTDSTTKIFQHIVEPEKKPVVETSELSKKKLSSKLSLPLPVIGKKKIGDNDDEPPRTIPRREVIAPTGRKFAKKMNANEANELAKALNSVTSFMKDKTSEQVSDLYLNEFKEKFTILLKLIRKYGNHHLSGIIEKAAKNATTENYETFKTAAIKLENQALQFTKKSQGFFTKTTPKNIKEINHKTSRFIERAQGRISTRRILDEKDKESLTMECQEQIDTINIIIGQMQNAPEPSQTDTRNLAEQRTRLFSTLDEINSPLQQVRTYSKPGSTIIKLNGTREEKFAAVKNAMGLPVNINSEKMATMKVGEEQFAKADKLTNEQFRIDPPDTYFPKSDINADEEEIEIHQEKNPDDEELTFSFSSGVGTINNNFMAIMNYDKKGVELASDEYLYDQAYKLLLKFHGEMNERDVGKKLILSDAVDARVAQAIFAVCKLSPEKFKKPRYSHDVSNKMTDSYLNRMDKHQRKKLTKWNIKEDKHAELSAREAKEREEPGFWQRLGF